MSQREHHCPFLNRSDERCSRNFSLDQLNQAYDYCFGHYTACPIYLQLLVERRMRQLHESARPGHAEHWQADGAGGGLVQIALQGQRA
ncbi:MAG TPA: hypothetical protein VFC78_24795 [Tepidisphaeraceae bacterium]|nr:hypothetical protein [Tepidisphaeraceae bacterium]